MQLLPSEIRYHIAELSSRNSLTAFAQTHSSYQRVAEKPLYNTLHTQVYADKESLKCMETLATNSEKASLVRFLTIDYDYNIYKNWLVITYLAKILIKMHTLSDFRVSSHTIVAG